MNFAWKNEFYRYHRYFSNIGRITKTAQVRSFAWISLSIFVISFFVLTAIRPTLVTIAQLNREIKDKKEASQKLQTKINSIVAAQKEYAQNVDYLGVLDQALPEKNEFPRLALFIEGVASSSGVELKSLGFEKITTSQVASKTTSSLLANSFNISLIVNGDYFKLKDFLKNLETSRRIIKMESISFIQSKKGEIWELSLQFAGRASFGKSPE